MAEKLRDAEPAIDIVYLRQNTRGAVETALAAEEWLDPTLPVVFMDCDIAFRSEEYLARVGGSALPTESGILLSFVSQDPRYSFAEIDEAGKVVRTAEKDPISSNALMGVYYFTRAATFLRFGKELLALGIDADRKEYYMSLVFNLMLQAGEEIGISSGVFYSFGTPDELARYEATRAPIS